MLTSYLLCLIQRFALIGLLNGVSDMIISVFFTSSNSLTLGLHGHTLVNIWMCIS